MKHDLLIFTLGTHERFAIDVTKTKEIITLGHLNQLPGSSPSILGVTKIRENVIPVVDTQGILFGITRGQTPKMAIVLDLEHPVALAVSDVSHVHKFDSETHTHAPGKGRFVETIIQDEHGLIQMLRTASIFEQATSPQGTHLQEGIAA